MTDVGMIGLTSVQRAGFGWLDDPSLHKVIAALEASRADGVRFVGGCVRDSLLGFVPKDFDLATPLKPDVVIQSLKDAGLRAVPTGIDHGTVTAIVDHQGVEVTTLRADVTTDGRRATVAFSEDWAVDARRRDFTINAIYLTPAGELYDPTNGLKDIKTRRVRFIGSAHDRLHEDYLRILRFFRFTGRFSKTIDAEGLAACTACKDGLSKLSAERIGAEFMAILRLDQARWVIGLMHEAGILKEIWQGAPNLDALDQIKKIAPEGSAPVVLATLFGEAGGGIGARLRLSNSEKSVGTKALSAAAQIKGGLTERAVQTMLYQLGRDVFSDAATIACAFGQVDQEAFEQFLKIADSWPIPVFPIDGRQVLKRGIVEGPAVAKILQSVEGQWIEEGFPDVRRAEAILETVIVAEH